MNREDFDQFKNEMDRFVAEVCERLFPATDHHTPRFPRNWADPGTREYPPIDVRDGKQGCGALLSSDPCNRHWRTAMSDLITNLTTNLC